jgi:hypothetical protein
MGHLPKPRALNTPTESLTPFATQPKAPPHTPKECGAERSRGALRKDSENLAAFHPPQAEPTPP